MKLIEAMNSLKLTEKKLNQKLGFLKRYSARPSFREDAFGKDGAEAKKIQEAVQSCQDLINEHEKIKRNIDYTNLVTVVDVVGRAYTIHSLILHKRTLIKLKRGVWANLDDSTAQTEVSMLRGKERESKITAQVVYNYDIQEKENRLMELSELESNIDSALQIANAKVELLDAPKIK